MPSRRRFLTSFGALGATALAGCLGVDLGGGPAGQQWSVTPGDGLGQYRVTDAGLFATVSAEAGEGATVGPDGRSHALVRLHTETGEERWRTDLGARADALHVAGDHAYVLLGFADDARTEVANDGYTELLAVDGSGDQRWRRELPSTRGPLVGDETGVYAVADQRAVGLSHDGTTRWQADLDHPGVQATADGGSLFVAGRRGRFDGSMAALDTETGAIRWQRDQAAETAFTRDAPLVANADNVYAAVDGALVALDRATGDTVWETHFGDGVVTTLDGTETDLSVATGTDNRGQDGSGRFGTLYRLSANDGLEQAEFRLDEPIVDAAFRGRQAAALTHTGRVVGTELGWPPVETRYEVDLGWEETGRGRIDALGDALYVETPEETILKLVPPTGTDEE